MADDLIGGLITPFAFLARDHGFSIQGPEDSGASGRGFVILASSDFQVRIACDRGDSYVDVAAASEPKEWFGLELIRTLILGGDLLEPRSLNDLAVFLRNNYDSIRQKLSSQNIRATSAQLRDLAKQRASQMFPQLYGREREQIRKEPP